MVSIFFNTSHRPLTSLSFKQMQTFSAKMYEQRSHPCTVVKNCNRRVYLREAILGSLSSFECIVACCCILRLGDSLLCFLLCVWTINENMTCLKQVGGVTWEGCWQRAHCFLFPDKRDKFERKFLTFDTSGCERNNLPINDTEVKLIFPVL